jgi:hypothetical protein
MAMRRVLSSATLMESEEALTGPILEEKNIVGDLSASRIKSYLERPTVQTYEEDLIQDNRKTPSAFSEFTKPKEKLIALMPASTSFPRTFIASESWEGYVIKTFNYYFSARITDLTEEEPDEDIEILYKDISTDDRKLIKPGAIFDWHVGNENDRGTIRRISIIRFRRLPRWSKSELTKATEIKEKIKDLLTSGE